MSDERYSENPDIQWALDLLKPDPTYELSILQKYISELVLVPSGFAVACFRNKFNRRPYFAGLQLHAACMVGGYILSQISNKVINHFKAERDTRLRNYVILHPELFPKPTRVKYANVLEPWTPVR